MHARDEFLTAAFWHGSVERAEAILAAHPEIAGDVHVAATVGDDATVREALARDPSLATATGGPRGVDPLTQLCFSAYLRDPARADAFVRAATSLLDAGASATTGFDEPAAGREPIRESAIYGAAGVAHHAPLTRLLLDRGADPNDEETPYHAPETHDLAALRALLDSGRCSPASLATMLLRKTDWHDLDGVRLLLRYGADPNAMTQWGKTALHNALLSDNGLAIVEALLDHGADPSIRATRPVRHGTAPERSAVQMAAWRGRGDALDLFATRGFDVRLGGIDALLAACARADDAAAARIAHEHPERLDALAARGGTVLAQFAGVGNVRGVRCLLDLGVPVDVPFVEGDPYLGVPAGSRALHVAAWRAQHPVVALLLARGAAPGDPDPEGRTPLALAVRACVDSYWRDRRAPDSVAALLAAGADPRSVTLPTGYAAADALLRAAAASD